MYLSVIFVFSGLGIVFLLGAKHLERKQEKRLWVLELISRGDRKVRDWAHTVTHYYAEFKEHAAFFIKKQLPLRSKSFLNKSHTAAEKGAEKFLVYIRNSKLLKKSDGLPEFFKNLSDYEKGNGTIDDDLDYNSLPGQNGEGEVK